MCTCALVCGHKTITECKAVSVFFRTHSSEDNMGGFSDDEINVAMHHFFFMRKQNEGYGVLMFGLIYNIHHLNNFHFHKRNAISLNKIKH